eukprot:CAMPEP_0198310764 /NCGR_PEP_ID=MMETSP1450-20131203/2711_1 /TAXON_ID=753684 ORGANISM="Madagascaria erythrocladiodes, Strain CCMP3234" /NCGR_SAMPLE_ID=MMETSP1450 /ASSEMBLY_ACC=CAM_ASM_001115 /LENGTH=145 /DNA_ID=CAMNT_0044013611 /DNA_START=164 /DNA_END=601 /DNA_ORIENTATION=+
MLIPPKDIQELDAANPVKMPEFNWNKEYVGTMVPGTDGDNFPLEDIMHVAGSMKYDELDEDERVAEILEPDEDILEWLASKGRLIPRGVEEDDDEFEMKRQMTGITEEDLEFDGDEDDMLSYYNRHDNPSQDPYANEYGASSTYS